MASKIVTAEHLQQLLSNAKGFDKILSKVKILSAKQGNCLAEVKIEDEHTNPMGTMHGGFSATLVDSISTYALMTHEKGCVPSVSVDIHMTYLKAAQIGDEILIDAKTTRRGKTLAFLDVLIKNKATGDLLVKGSHTKYLMQPKS